MWISASTTKNNLAAQNLNSICRFPPHQIPFILLLQIIGLLESNLDTKSGKQVEQPGEGIVLILPIAAMFALIGVLALLMRSTGKW
jgi:hypothetical protein